MLTDQAHSHHSARPASASTIDVSSMARVASDVLHRRCTAAATTTTTDTETRTQAEYENHSIISLRDVAPILKRSGHKTLSYTRVFKATLQPRENAPASVVIRQAPADFNAQNSKDWNIVAFLRDWAALEFLSTIKSPRAHAPQFFGGHRPLGTMVLEDLGPGDQSLIDLFQAQPSPQSKRAAEQAVFRLARRLASMHIDTLGQDSRDGFYSVLSRLNPVVASSLATQPPGSLSEMRQTDAVETVELFGDLSPDQAARVAAEVEHMIDILVTTKSHNLAMLHMELRPERVILRRSGNVRLVGFRSAQPGHPLLDVAFILISWLPIQFIRPFLSVYRGQIQLSLNGLSDDDPAKETDLVDDTWFSAAALSASGYWLIRHLEYLADAEDSSSEDEDAPSAPAVFSDSSLRLKLESIARINSFLALYGELSDRQSGTHMECLRKAVLRLRDALAKRWGVEATRTAPLPRCCL